MSPFQPQGDGGKENSGAGAQEAPPSVPSSTPLPFYPRFPNYAPADFGAAPAAPRPFPAPQPGDEKTVSARPPRTACRGPSRPRT